MDISDLFPQHKSDFERTENFKKLIKIEFGQLFLSYLYGFKTVIGLYHPKYDISLPFNKELVPHIINILRSNDGDLKYFLLTGLVSGLPKETIAELKPDLFEIAHNPSVSDKASEVDETAKEILNMID